VSTYNACGFIIFPPLPECTVSQRCFRMFLLRKSLLTFTVSFFPEIVFKKFFAKFISQCITSKVYLISSFCKTCASRYDGDVPFVLTYPSARASAPTNNKVARQSFLSSREVVRVSPHVHKPVETLIQLHFSCILVSYEKNSSITLQS
jgi:hypothetical protein